MKTSKEVFRLSNEVLTSSAPDQDIVESTLSYGEQFNKFCKLLSLYGAQWCQSNRFMENDILTDIIDFKIILFDSFVIQM